MKKLLRVNSVRSKIYLKLVYDLRLLLDLDTPDTPYFSIFLEDIQPKDFFHFSHHKPPQVVIESVKEGWYHQDRDR